MFESTEGREPAERRRLSRQAGPWLWWLLAFAWMALIYYFSDQSQLVFPVTLWWSDLLSWLAHFAEYAILAGLIWVAAHSTPALSRYAGVIALVVAGLYALSDEVHQGFVPGRVPDVRDWMVDVAGAALAVWLLARHRK